MEPIYQGYIHILNHGMLLHYNKNITEQEIVRKDSGTYCLRIHTFKISLFK